MRRLTLSTLSLLISCVFSFPFTLPGDPKWPTTAEFSDFKKSMNCKVILPSDADYKPHTWNRITNVPKPAVIVQPVNSNNVIEALKFAKNHNIRVSVQSTGHHQDHRNIYDNSVHIDMSSMNAKRIDLDKKTLTLGPGNNFSVIQEYVARESNGKLVALGGADKGVGIYGWTTGGGHGALTRLYGLGVDALLSVDLVISNLTVITASATQNVELFRALRGSGGGTYGIALSLTVQLYDDPGKVSILRGFYEFNEITAERCGNWLINAPNHAGAYIIFNNIGNKYIYFGAHCFSSGANCYNALSPLLTGCFNADNPDLCQVKIDRFSNYNEFINSGESDTGGVAYLSSTVLNAGNIVAGLKEIGGYIIDNSYTGCYGNSILGGASATIDLNQVNTTVATEMRTSLMALTCYSAMDDSSSVTDRKYQVDVMDNLAENIFKKYSKWVYWNEPQHNFPKDDWKERYWGGLPNYNKLLEVKKRYDPEGFFTCYHCVGYERVDNEDPSVCPLDKCTCSNTPNGVCSKFENGSQSQLVSSNLLLILVFPLSFMLLI